MKDIVRFPSVSRIHFIECPANGGMEWRAAQLNSLQFNHGMISCAEWTGVRLSTLLEEVGVKKEAAWAMVEGADGAHMNRSLPLNKCLDDCLVVYAQNGEALRPEQGYPLRLVVPGWEGNVSIKWLRRIKLGDKPWYSREETSKYTDLMPDGTSRGFTWLIDAKSVITFPCPEKPLTGPGLYEIRGLAWTGNGKVKRVDVSVDGGVNWQSARLHEPVLSKALTKFTLPWRWDGKPALLESRVIDETGYVQPTITQLRKKRGMNSVYHNNSIQTWQVKPDGSVFDVQTRLSALLLLGASPWSPPPRRRARRNPVLSATARSPRRRRSRAGTSTFAATMAPACRPEAAASAKGDGGVCRAMRRVPRHVRRGRRPLSQAGRRQGDAEGRPAGTDGRQLLAVCADAVGLH